ncbi:MAG: hypothetical protein ACFFDW_12240 [Candidatus Thorarchaeota archaeon]
MNQRIKLILMLNFITALFLFSTISSGYGANREWNAGDVYIWGVKMYTSVTEIDEEELITEIITEDILTEIKYNITGVDTVAKEFDAIVTSSSGTTFETDQPFAMDEFTDSLNLASDFAANWAWNYETNHSVMYDFGFEVGYFYLIEPNWLVMNNDLKDYFNTSLVIDTYLNPYTSQTHNVTFNDALLNATRYEIMGVKDIVKAKNKFTESTTKWTFEFDYSNVLHSRQWNSTAGHFDYYPYEEYLLILELSYTDGGVLSKIIYENTYKISLFDITYDYLYNFETELGGIKSLTADCNILLVLPALFVVAGLIKLKRK